MGFCRVGFYPLLRLALQGAPFTIACLRSFHPLSCSTVLEDDGPTFSCQLLQYGLGIGNAGTKKHCLTGRGRPPGRDGVFVLYLVGGAAGFVRRWGFFASLRFRVAHCDGLRDRSLGICHQGNKQLLATDPSGARGGGLCSRPLDGSHVLANSVSALATNAFIGVDLDDAFGLQGADRRRLLGKSSKHHPAGYYMELLVWRGQKRGGGGYTAHDGRGDAADVVVLVVWPPQRRPFPVSYTPSFTTRSRSPRLWAPGNSPGPPGHARVRRRSP